MVKLNQFRTVVLAGCLFVCLFSVAIAEDKVVSGTLTGYIVNDTGGTPLPSAVVLIHKNSGGQVIALNVDSGGRFKASLAPGLYEVFASEKSFDPFCKLILIGEGHTVDVPIKLKGDIEYADE